MKAAIAAWCMVAMMMSKEASGTVTSATSSSDDGNVAANVLDGSVLTRWSAEGDGEWLMLTMDNEYVLSGVKIAFHLGNERTTDFKIDVSTDGTRWTSAVAQTSSSGTTIWNEEFDFSALMKARYVRYTGYGNWENDWNSVTKFGVVKSSPATCQRGWRCWPSDEEVAAFETALNPEMNRTIENVDGEPYTAPFPTDIDGLPVQPLYGLGLVQMEPLYVKPDTATETCTASGTFASDFCKAQVTGEPLQSQDADFVVFALTAEHVQTAVQFALDHKLCISVTGTGHDFMGRNQPNHCGSGGSLLIRTTLMQSLEADLEDEAGLGSAAFRFGAGVVFSKAQAFAADHGHLIAAGWCETVGVVGWTLGGGNGPLAPRYGFGADNLLAADVVLADGSLVTAKASGKYSDLFKALRGGGGSTWGVITSVTVKAHPTPEDGVVAIGAYAAGNLCDAAGYRTLLQDFADVQAAFNEKQAATAITVTTYGDFDDCSTSSYIFAANFVITANMTSDETQEVLAFIAARPSYIVSQAVPFANYNDASTFVSLFRGSDGYARIDNGEPRAVPLSNALVQREDTDAIVDHMMNFTQTNSYTVQTLSSSLTGQNGAFESTGTSMSDSLRSALFHYVAWYADVDTQAELRGKFGTEVYFNEASREITDIGSAYWGNSIYYKLLTTKYSYDPQRVFGCINCV